MGGIPLNTTAGAPVNLMMTFPTRMTKQPQQSCKTIGIIVPAEPGRSDGNLCLAHQWPACHRTSSPSPKKHSFSKFLHHHLVFDFRSVNRIKQKPIVSGAITLPLRNPPHFRRHAIHHLVQGTLQFAITVRSFKSLERQQRALQRRSHTHNPFAHAISPVHPFRRGVRAASNPLSTRDPNLGPGVHNRSQRFGAHSLGFRPGHKLCLPVEPQPTGNVLPAGYPAAFGKRVMKPPSRGSVRDLNTIPLTFCLSGSLTTKYAFPFPWPKHSRPSPMMADTHDRREHFAFRETGYEALPLITAAHQPYR